MHTMPPDMPAMTGSATDMSIMPGWVRLLWTIALLVVALLHVWHARVQSGQGRWWHGTHVVMALGMAAMYGADSMRQSRLDHWLTAVFAVVTVALVIVIVVVRQRERAVSMRWMATAIDSAAMTYMAAPHALAVRCSPGDHLDHRRLSRRRHPRLADRLVGPAPAGATHDCRADRTRRPRRSYQPRHHDRGDGRDARLDARITVCNPAGTTRPCHPTYSCRDRSQTGRNERGKATTVIETVYRVSGMSCGHCAAAVTEALTELSGVDEVNVDIDRGAVTVHSDTALSVDLVRAAVQDAGYSLADT